jgi:hypothetical protein
MVYNTIEGRPKGIEFSACRARHRAVGRRSGLAWPKISVFFLGKGVSLLAGFGTILLTFLTIRRMREVDHPGLAAGLVVLATSGPLAVWSSSSLDTVPFTFLLTLLVFALVCRNGPFARRGLTASPWSRQCSSRSSGSTAPYSWRQWRAPGSSSRPALGNARSSCA